MNGVRVRAVLATASLGLCLAIGACKNDLTSEDPDASNARQPLTPITISTTPNGLLQLVLETYERSGESVEPDVVHLPGGWHGYEYWMVFEPYPGGNPAFENASIAASHDGINWEIPAGIVNPVIPGPGFQGVQHNSDPDLNYVPQLDRMVLTYRGVTTDKNIMYAVTSNDGVHWSSPVKVASEPNHSLVMPTIVLAPGRRAKLYYVNAGTLGCASQGTSVMMRRWMADLHKDDALIGTSWSKPITVDIPPPPGFVIWHLDVVWVEERKEYWAVFPAYRTLVGCGTSDLFVARSRDGVKWETLVDPIFEHGAAPWTSGSLYRASLEYDGAGKQFRLWFSARSNGVNWHIGHQTFPLTDVLDQFNRRGTVTSVAASAAVNAPGQPRQQPLPHISHRSLFDTSSPPPDVSP